MQLEKLTYSELVGDAQEWSLDGLRLGTRNLIVGKNASGKTRVLNIIANLARNLAGLRPPTSGEYDVTFRDGVETYRYRVKCEKGEVVEERFEIGGRVMLDRGRGGEGRIFSNEIGEGTEVRFQTPPDKFAAVARQDSIQHPFLSALQDWGNSVRHYHFGSQLGKDHYFVATAKNEPELDERDENAVVGLFQKGQRQFGSPFVTAIVSDLLGIGYDVESVGLGSPTSVTFPAAITATPIGLYVQERGLKGVTDQHSMSQGMFRALSLFVHVNYCNFRQQPTCILIDDIGEGLDFDRSCALIDTIRKKTETRVVQTVLTTNDRFVMNRVPLEEWSVLQRKGSAVSVRNYENSKQVFDEFKFTGLSNFSFLELDIVNDPDAGEAAI